MKNKPEKTPPQIALISTPWPPFNRPSVQIGTLKAYLKARIPNLHIDTFHFYLQAAFAQLKRLDDLPAPEYGAYFSLLKTFKPHKRFFPTLPVEA